MSLSSCALAPACGGGAGRGGDGSPEPLALTPATLDDGTSGGTYAETLTASGGAGGYTWEVIAGALPPGISGLPASGTMVGLTGVLGAPGVYPFRVRLRDAGGTVLHRLLSITVQPSGSVGGAADRATALAGAPGGRHGHSAVWTGTEMIVWGGSDLWAPYGDGAAYDPATDTWRTISAVGEPSARTWHTAVWTGTEMIVWGGWGPSGPLSTGGAYDPARDTWRAVATSAAPAPRALHTATWTGGAMLVWAGQGQFTTTPHPNAVDLVLPDGAAYDPFMDVWTPLASGGPPARGHTGVWTGTRMVTWGGRDDFALTISTMDRGGVYDPVGNAWTATSLSGAPNPRHAHTAVWTGSEMIVWGGSDGVGVVPLATGARLRPDANIWTPTTTAGAPPARSEHAAVWTGHEMVVWGGDAGTGAPLADGAAYDPVSDSWRPVVPAVALDGRAGHTAVWTGAAMIVWGGRGASGVHLSSGAVIHP